MKNKTKYSITFFLGLILLNLFLWQITYAQTPATKLPKPSTKYEKLNYIINKFVESAKEVNERSGENFNENETDPARLMQLARLRRGAFPCINFEPKYYQSGPFWITGSYANPTVGAPWGYEIQRGYLSSNFYKTASFGSLAEQVYSRGQKRYYFPAFYVDMDSASYIEKKLKEPGNTKSKEQLKLEFDNLMKTYLRDNPDGEFVGYISFKVKQHKVPYSEEKHKDWPLTTDVTHRGDEVVMTQKTVKDEDHVQHGPDYVVTETCYDPQPHLADVDFNTDEPNHQRFLEVIMNQRGGEIASGGKVFHYEKDDVPTGLMFDIAENQRLQGTVEALNVAEAGVLMLGYSTPGVSTVLSYRDFKRCKEAGDPHCYLEFTAAVVSDIANIGGLLKLPLKAVKVKQLKELGEISKAVGMLDKATDAMLYTGVITKTGLAGFYAGREEWAKSTGSLLSAAIDGAVIFHTHGKLVGVDVGEIKPHCQGQSGTQVLSVANNEFNPVHSGEVKGYGTMRQNLEASGHEINVKYKDQGVVRCYDECVKNGREQNCGWCTLASIEAAHGKPTVALDAFSPEAPEYSLINYWVAEAAEARGGKAFFISTNGEKAVAPWIMNGEHDLLTWMSQQPPGSAAAVAVRWDNADNYGHFIALYKDTDLSMFYHDAQWHEFGNSLSTMYDTPIKERIEVYPFFPAKE